MNFPWRNEIGLTLIELLSVIIILAIIAAIAIPSISEIIKNTKDKAILSDIQAMIISAEIAVLDDSCGPDLICTYNSSNNEIGFNSNKFDTGEVDFSNGKAASLVNVKVNISVNQFKGRNAEVYADLVSDSKSFTKKELLELLN